MKTIIRAVLVLLMMQGVAIGQTLSPYSSLGIGDIYTKAMVQHYSMGGIGLSNGSFFYQNTLNPALIADNGVYSFTAGFTGETRTYWQQEDREVAKGGTLSYMNIIWPINQGKLAMSVGMFPYSRVNYNFKATSTVGGNPDAEVTSFNEGEGGFNQFIFSLGGKMTKNLYLGGNVSYLFSSIDKKTSAFLSDPIGPYVPTSRTRITAGDFIYGLGFAYKQPLGDQSRLSIGGVYNFQKDVSVEMSKTLITNTRTNTPIQIDTLLDNQEGQIHLPASYGVGISFEKLNKFMVGVDINLQPWQEFRGFDDVQTELVNSVKIGIGGEFIPNFASVDNYLSRITYRFGFNYEKTPYFISDTQINELGMKFGFSLPVASVSSGDFGIRYGTRGTIDNGLIKDNFVRIYFGVTFNDNRWFVRPKFN